MSTEKYTNLINNLRSFDKVAVSFSGGVDSTFLLYAAKEALGENVIAITADSSVLPHSEFDEAKSLCESLGVRHITFEFNPLSVDEFRSNVKERCYYCKKSLMSVMREIAHENGFDVLVEGSNTDDELDYRPGSKALQEMRIISPLNEAGLSKQEIRDLSKKFNLPTWDKPSYACLATRIPYGEEITLSKLNMVEKGEAILHEHGFLQSRVRAHGSVARLEIMPCDFDKVLSEDVRSAVVQGIKDSGFDYVSLDLEGFKSGSMNIGVTTN